PLVTEKTGEDDAYVYYTAQTSRFSMFAIVSTGTYDLAQDPVAGVTSSGIIGKGGILGGSDAKGDTDEIPYYNTYMSAALLLVSLFVAGAAGIAGLKYITRPDISGNRDEKDSMQFKK
ncbi:PGF-pre-PGF domain-containing protein, partial [Methanomethylovorans sp.]|uniref:PGF-pre-PGF domain-containing protein n=1 Tax=Methanomethylovorans sp. TaxID=2758717 RepID=UPI00351C004D